MFFDGSVRKMEKAAGQKWPVKQCGKGNEKTFDCYEGMF